MKARRAISVHAKGWLEDFDFSTAQPQGMTSGNDFVLVQKSLFDSLRHHCEQCPGFDLILRSS